MLDGPFGRVCRERAIGIPALILDHIPDIDDDIRERFPRAPDIPDADLPIPEIGMPDGRQNFAQGLIARVIRVQRDLHVVPPEGLDAAIWQQIDAVDEIRYVVALGGLGAHGRYLDIWMVPKILLQLLPVRSDAPHSCIHILSSYSRPANTAASSPLHS